MPPDEEFAGELSWFVDGSMFDGRWLPLGRVGFGILAIADDGAIIALGYGVPPSWIRSVPGAEAWALWSAAQYSASARRYVTDCMGVRDGVAKGQNDATAASCPLARLWGLIHTAFDGGDEQVVWMPAHLTRLAAASRLKSDGSQVTMLE